MPTKALFPDSPHVVTDQGRQFIQVAWAEAESVRQLLKKHGLLATLCLNPETQQARLELWPGVLPEAVLAVLESRTATPAGRVVPAELKKGRAPSAKAADAVCI